MLRRIAGKGIVSHIRKDLISGHEAAWESIIATMHKIYEEDKSESILLAEVSPIYLTQSTGKHFHTMLESNVPYCKFCLKLLQSSFPTFHDWWRGNSIY